MIGLIRASSLALLGLCFSLLVGCSGGGSSGGGTSTGGQAGLPPDPGPAGLATLAGIDSNSNGVRDDIERYIALTYPANNEAATRSALTQYTKAIQASLLSATDPVATQTYAQARIAALGCLVSRRPTDAQALFGALRAQALNTEERSQAYFLAEQQMGGQIVPVPSPDTWATACTNG